MMFKKKVFQNIEVGGIREVRRSADLLEPLINLKREIKILEKKQNNNFFSVNESLDTISFFE